MNSDKFYCTECGAENEVNSKYCRMCGTHLYATSTKKPGNVWYLLPIIFNIIGGIIAYFAIRNKNRQMAKNLLQIGLLIFVLVFGYIIFYPYPDTILMNVQTPSLVQSDQEFDIVVSIMNNGTEPQILGSIVIPDEYLEGIAIISSDPQFKQTSSTFGEEYHHYDIDIPAGKEQIITFKAIGINAGVFSARVWADTAGYPGMDVRTVVSNSNVSTNSSEELDITVV
ncbi:zinc ribbon domain-containing protein [Methanolobus zinderi]|uniref:Zinc ribbon domain-containing protein n=1 Tax=Methanolobus zinderi TaxID=536044 RepID=A0A7D5I4F8_9EURY|nr:zinc ribbon domain-containing protein [Methanolobus zinderi]QLC49561.1 zinc ribbon domain-containing protein [Methanolobus zinderi]